MVDGWDTSAYIPFVSICKGVESDEYAFALLRDDGSTQISFPDSSLSFQWTAQLTLTVSQAKWVHESLGVSCHAHLLLVNTY
jgi:hypothetical protein